LSGLQLQPSGGLGGLGVLLFDGIAAGRYDKIWAGAIAVAILRN